MEGLFLVESKALTTNLETLGRTEQRRAAAVEKHVLKAVGQLAGAVKRLKRGDEVLRCDGSPLQADPPTVAGLVEPIDLLGRAQQVGHAIVVLSDMHPSVDWASTAKALIAARNATGFPFHVMDLRELQRMVSHSRERPVLMEANLARRWETVVKGGSAKVRAMAPPPETESEAH